jgi:hypothetical protein
VKKPYSLEYVVVGGNFEKCENTRWVGRVAEMPKSKPKIAVIALKPNIRNRNTRVLL